MKDQVLVDDNALSAGDTTRTECSLVPLRKTTSSMHRIHFEISTLDQWYDIIREANQMFGSGNWVGQRKVRRKIEQMPYRVLGSVPVWFDVPDERFGTWVSIKHAVRMTKITHK